MLKKLLKPIIIISCFLMSVLPVSASGEIREPVQEEYLTEEQASEGWVLIDGYAYSPEYIAEAEASLGETGEQMYDIKTAAANGIKTNLVTIRADVPAGMTDPVYLEIMDGATYQTYYVELYSATGYSDNFKLPHGYYYFMAGGPTNDTMSVFSVSEPEYFMVQDEDTSVTAYIRPRGTILQHSSETEETQSVMQEENEETQPSEQQTGFSRKFYLIGAIIMFGIGITLLILWFIRGKHTD